MSGIEVRVEGYGGRAFERALGEFKRRVSASGIMSEVRSRRFYRPPSVVRKMKKAVKREKSRLNAENGRRF